MEHPTPPAEGLSPFSANESQWRHYALLASVLAGAMAALGLSAHVLPRVLEVLPAPDLPLVGVRANSALCLLALAAAAALQAHRPRQARAMIVDSLCLASAVVAALTAWQYINGRDLGIDNLLLDHPFDAVPHPGRMALPVAVAMALLAAGIAVQQLPPEHLLRRAGTLLTSLAVFVPYVGSVLLLHNSAAPTWGAVSLGSTSLTTNTALLLIGTAVFAQQSAHHGYRPRGPASVSGRYLRAVAPMALLLPVLIAWMRWAAERAGWYGSDRVLMWMLALSTAIFLTAVLLSRHWMARFEQALWQSQERLEARVRERTADLADAMLRLQETEQRFRVLAEASPALIWTSDAEQRITYINKSLADYTGAPLALHQGQGWRVFTHPDDVEATEAEVRAAMGSRRVFQSQHRIRGADGHHRWFAVHAAPLYEGDRFIGYVGTCTDIHEAKTAALALKRSEQQLAAIIEFADVAIVSVDETLRIVVFNAAAERMFGRRAADMMGQSVDPLLPVRARTGHDRKMAEFAGSGQTIRKLQPMPGGEELAGLRANGEEFPIEASISRSEVDGGRLLTVVIRDLSQARALERERSARAAAEEASLAKTRFLSHLSHELRTPLNAVIGFSQLLLHQQSVARDSAVERYAQHILDAGRHQLSMINDLLDLNRIEANQIQLDVAELPLARAVHESVQLVLPQAGAAGIELLWQQALDSPCGVMADEARLRQILVNLLTNAVKYNRPGGRVELAVTRPSAGEIGVAVQDNGLGMTAAQLAELFVPFNRLGREKSAIEGTGIGLSLSRRLAEIMGGRIEVASVPDLGSTFTLVLPIGRNGDCRPSSASDATTHEAGPANAKGLPQETFMSTFDPARQPHAPTPSGTAKEPSDAQAKRTQAAVENVREGYGKSAKAGIISGKPDGDTQGGPGGNNDNANQPAPTGSR